MTESLLNKKGKAVFFSNKSYQMFKEQVIEITQYSSEKNEDERILHKWFYETGIIKTKDMKIIKVLGNILMT